MNFIVEHGRLVYLLYKLDEYSLTCILCETVKSPGTNCIEKINLVVCPIEFLLPNYLAPWNCLRFCYYNMRLSSAPMDVCLHYSITFLQYCIETQKLIWAYILGIINNYPSVTTSLMVFPSCNAWIAPANHWKYK